MPKYMKYKATPKGKKRQLRVKREHLQDVWETRMMEAEACKLAWKERFNCDKLQRFYEGDQVPDDWEDDWFNINLIFSSATILRRNVCPKSLRVNLNLSRTFVAEAEAIDQMESVVRIREAVLQYIFDSQSVWRTGRTSYDNALYQFGVLKVGYSADMIANPKAGRVMQHLDGTATRTVEGSVVFEEDYVIENEEFFVDHVDPDCFLVDRHCREDLDKTGRWCAQKFFIPLEEARRKREWNKGILNDLRASALEESEKIFVRQNNQYLAKFTWDAGTYLPENELVVGYEIYDLLRAETLTLIRGAKDIVRGPTELPPGVARHPFVVVKFTDVKNEFYPIPLIYNWLGPQDEYNYTRNRMSIHRRRFNRKYAYTEGGIDEEEREKMETGGDGTMVKFNKAGAVEPIKDAPLDSGYFFDTNTLREEFMQLSKVGQLQRSTIGADSATEAEIVEGRAREGELDEHEEMMIMLSEVAKKLHDSMEANLTQEGAVRKVGPGGAQWVSFGPENFDVIDGEVLFNVEVSADQRITLQVERAQLMQLLDIIGKNPTIALDDGLLRAIFDKFPALSNREDLVYRVQKLAAFSVQAQMMGNVKSGGAQKKVGASSTGKEAKKARQVSS